MNRAMPPEMQLSEARRVDDRYPALTAGLKAARYEIRFRDAEQGKRMSAAIPAMMEQESITAVRKTKSGMKECDIKPMIYALRGDENAVYATLALTERETCKPGMLMDALKKTAGEPEEEEVRTLVVRTALLGEDEKGAFVPLERL